MLEEVKKLMQNAHIPAHAIRVAELYRDSDLAGGAMPNYKAKNSCYGNV